MERTTPSCASPHCNFNDLNINCEGSCRQRFHAVCVGLSPASVPVISSSPNLFWFCDVCRDHTWSRSGSSVEQRSCGEENSCGSTNCIFTDQLIKCDGSCGKDFHGMCVKLSKGDLLVIGSSSNILWVCDGCKGDLPPIRDEDEKTPELEAEHQVEDDSMIVQLKSIIEKLDKLSTNLENGIHNTPPDSSPNSEGSSCGEDFDEKDHATDLAVDNIVTVTDAAKEDILSIPETRNSLDSSSLMDKPPDVESQMKDPTKIKQSESPIENSNFQAPETSTGDARTRVGNRQQQQPSKTGEIPQETAPVKKAEVVPVPKKDDYKFALWIKFDDPDISNSEACSIVRKALGMTSKDSVGARNVVPSMYRFTREALYVSFKVDLDARWRKKALDGATWRSVEDYLEHSEWVDRY